MGKVIDRTLESMELIATEEISTCISAEWSAHLLSNQKLHIRFSFFFSLSEVQRRSMNFSEGPGNASC